MLTRMSPVHIEPTAQVARGSPSQRVAELAAANSSRSWDRGTMSATAGDDV